MPTAHDNKRLSAAISGLNSGLQIESDRLMAKRISLIAIILIICFAFFVAVRVPAQTVEHNSAIQSHALAGEGLSSGH